MSLEEMQHNSIATAGYELPSRNRVIVRSLKVEKGTVARPFSDSGDEDGRMGVAGGE